MHSRFDLPLSQFWYFANELKSTGALGFPKKWKYIEEKGKRDPPLQATTGIIFAIELS